MIRGRVSHFILAVTRRAASAPLQNTAHYGAAVAQEPGHRDALGLIAAGLGVTLIPALYHPEFDGYFNLKTASV